MDKYFINNYVFTEIDKFYDLKINDDINLLFFNKDVVKKSDVYEQYEFNYNKTFIEKFSNQKNFNEKRLLINYEGEYYLSIFVLTFLPYIRGNSYEISKIDEKLFKNKNKSKERKTRKNNKEEFEESEEEDE